jgi:hypothetical protein
MTDIWYGIIVFLSWKCWEQVGNVLLPFLQYLN